MKISRVGGIIAAASKKAAYPMLQVGSIPIIKRIVLTFQQAGIFPIVVITGTEEYEVKYQLSNQGVIFLRNEQCEAPPLFDSVKIGLSYLQDKCERVAFVPVNVPMFSHDVLKALMDTDGDIITPSYNRKGGHPILLSSKIIPEILAYKGDSGLRGAISALASRRTRVDVDCEGIVLNVHDGNQLQALLEEHNSSLLHPYVQISLEKEALFFNSRLKLLLLLISDSKSVRKACDQMALSHGKAWNMINNLEKELGYPIVDRRHGGKQGGKTELTELGLEFLKAYQNFEDNVFQYTQNEFQRLFRQTKLL